MNIINEKINFERFFNPRAIAIFGVNKKPFGGSYFLRCLNISKFNNPIFPINPKLAGTNVMGHTVYASLDDIPLEVHIDLCIIAIPSKYTPDIMNQLGNRKVPFAHIFSSGYSEIGAEDIETRLLQKAKENKVRIIGPNCLGAYNPRSKLSFTDGLSEKSGNVAFISQSGGLSIRLAVTGNSRDIYFSKIVSIGNQIDLGFNEFLEYFGEDPETKIVSLYLENIKRDGRRFFELLNSISKRKPVIIWKGGRSEKGNDAILSHTGGMAGNYKIWESMAKQTGVILVNTFQELIETIQAFSFYNFPKTNKIAAICTGGRNSIEAMDMCIEQGLEVPQISEENQKKMSQFIPDVNSNVKNPFDLGALGLNTTAYGKTLEVLSHEPEISIVIITNAPEKHYQYGKLLGIEDFDKEFVENLQKGRSSDKMVLSVPMILNETETSQIALHKFLKSLEKIGIVSFQNIESAARCAFRIWNYYNIIQKKNLHTQLN